MNRLKVLRAEHGLTQKDLAERANVSRQTIIAVEKGKFDPSLSLARRISLIFDQPIEKIFFPGE